VESHATARLRQHPSPAASTTATTDLPTTPDTATAPDNNHCHDVGRHCGDVDHHYHDVDHDRRAHGQLGRRRLPAD
jgi:hypothetical protein